MHPDFNWSAAEVSAGTLRAPIVGDIDDDWTELFVQFAHDDIAGLSSIMFSTIGVVGGEMVVSGAVGSPESFRANLTKVAERAGVARDQLEKQRELDAQHRARAAEQQRRQDEEATRRIREAGDD